MTSAMRPPANLPLHARGLRRGRARGDVSRVRVRGGQMRGATRGGSGRARSLGEGIRQQLARPVPIFGRFAQRCHVRVDEVARCVTRSALERVRHEASVPPRVQFRTLTQLVKRPRSCLADHRGTPGSVDLELVRLYTATMAAWEMTKEALRKVCRDNNG